MASAETPLSIVVEWMNKAFDFSDNDNSLNDIFLSLLDVLSAILKDSGTSAIQRALASLDSKRSICLRLEEDKDDSIRSLMYGLLECIHLTILYLTGHRESADISLEIIKEWRKKAFEIKAQSVDSLISLFLNLLNAMSLILKSAQHNSSGEGPNGHTQ
ncbi:hypothetical protein PMAYCL1PPCAC_13934 [Pristionchus mayeri]|uniref:Uncharacterized protein n=1 Tax=Pristionchus mayeri TaxID=1317129 RepID=A0AAN4ZQW3_9BILA|nr:hypothetical protein PMAYCL1PPCAC_13934 [Pristionchus mayeri]